MIKAILACDAQGGIAKNGVMPWPHNKKDLQHFSKLTRGATIVMGRVTWDAVDMPTPLPGRKNVVITNDSAYTAPGATVISTNHLDEVDALADEDTVFIIGGARIFSLFIDKIDILHLTRIIGQYDCDTFLPMDIITEKFELIDQIDVDQSTRFELYFSKYMHDLEISNKLLAKN